MHYIGPIRFVPAGFLIAGVRYCSDAHGVQMQSAQWKSCNSSDMRLEAALNLLIAFFAVELFLFPAARRHDWYSRCGMGVLVVAGRRVMGSRGGAA